MEVDTPIRDGGSGHPNTSWDCYAELGAALVRGLSGGIQRHTLTLTSLTIWGCPALHLILPLEADSSSN